MPPLTWMAVAGDAIAIVALSVLLYADKIPLEFFASTFTALVVARGIANKTRGQDDGKGGGLPPSAVSGLAILLGLLASVLSRGRIAIATLALALALAVASCCRVSERPACSSTALYALEVAYLDEVVTTCKEQGYDACKELPEIEARYEARREAWARCR